LATNFAREFYQYALTILMNRSRSRRTPNAPEKVHGGRNFVRIIGGVWRSRRIQFPATTTLRPTPDRVRETLFNWLHPLTSGARCLDLFAGSGALAIEALSRGAAEAILVERDPQVVRYLRDTLSLLGAANATVIQEDARRYLKGAPRRFDIVFLDPPFADAGFEDLCAQLAEEAWVERGGFVYVERPAAAGLLQLPAGWETIRAKKAGEVGYYLVRAGDPAASK
jgi:16S rRNA (guanine966-N2)-methyltransferase